MSGTQIGYICFVLSLSEYERVAHLSLLSSTALEELEEEAKDAEVTEEAVGTEEAEAAEEVAGGEAERKEGEAVTEESRWRGTRRCLNRSSGG